MAKLIAANRRGSQYRSSSWWEVGWRDGLVLKERWTGQKAELGKGLAIADRQLIDVFLVNVCEPVAFAVGRRFWHRAPTARTMSSGH
jgi:hypothetical protein